MKVIVPQILSFPWNRTTYFFYSLGGDKSIFICNKNNNFKKITKIQAISVHIIRYTLQIFNSFLIDWGFFPLPDAYNIIPFALPSKSPEFITVGFCLSIGDAVTFGVRVISVDLPFVNALEVNGMHKDI